MQRTFGVIKPGFEAVWGSIIDQIISSGLSIVEMKMISFDENIVIDFLADQKHETNFGKLVESFLGGPSIVLELEGEDAISRWLEVIGPETRAEAVEDSPESINSVYGNDEKGSVCYGSDSPFSAVRDIQAIFGRRPPGTEDHTYAMIKPGYEAVWGKVIERITDEGLEIMQMKTMEFDNDFADKFYVEHVGKKFYPSLQMYMTSGPVVAMELVGKDAITKWRQIIGPTNKEVALETAPESLRALYARSTTENLCHGSDSVESAVRELTLVFGAAPEYMIKKLKPAEFEESTIADLDELESIALECKDIPTRSNLKQQYLDSTVMPIVLEGLSWIMKERPSDPVEHLALYLLKNRNQEPEQHKEEPNPQPISNTTPATKK